MSILKKIGGAVSSVANVVGAGLGLISDNKNRKQQDKTNREQQAFSREMYGKQVEDNERFWNMQNAYNDPSAQMNRLSEAGLNPHLVYGNGATTTAGPVSSASAPSWNPKAPQTKAGEIAQQGIQNHVMLKQASANIAKTEAEARATQIGADNQEFLNKVNTDDYLEALKFEKRNMPRMKTLEQSALTSQAQWKQETDAVNFRNLQKLSGEAGDGSANLIVQKYAKELNNLKALGDVRAWDAKLKMLEYDLAKLGIFKGDQLWQRAVGRTLSTFGETVMKNNFKSAEEAGQRFKQNR